MTKWSNETLSKIWDKGHNIPGLSPYSYKKDDFGRTMKYSEYGKCSIYGWQVDHIIPSLFGGVNHIINLRPLHFSNNTSLGGRLSGMSKLMKKLYNGERK